MNEREKSILEFKQFLSNWSDKEVNGEKINNLLQLGGFPLSWYYRPILYSSLLPPPFVTVDDFLDEKKVQKIKINCYSYAFQKSLRWRDQIRQATVHFKKTRKRKKIIVVSKDDKENDVSSSIKPKILILTFTNYLKDSPIPFREEKIIKKIEEDNQYEAFVLAAEPLSAFSPKKIFQIPHTIYDYYNREANEKAKKKGAKLAQRWQEIDIEEKKKILTFKGKDSFSYYQKNLDFLYSKNFISTIARFYYTYLDLLKKENIKAIILSSQNNIFEKCIITAAFKKNIPIFVVQHGIALGDSRTINTPKNVKFEVFGDEFKHKLIKLGAGENNVEVTGPIIFDGIERFIEKKEDKKEEKKMKGRKILFTTSPMVEDRFIDQTIYFQRIKKILADLQKIKPEKIIINLHPREKNLEEYKKLIEEINLSASISATVSREELYSFIRECDLAINFGSTVAMEAMIIGRPTLSIDIFDRYNPTNKVVINSGATNFVKYDEDLFKIVEELLQYNNKEEEAKEFISKNCYKIDGRASERIVINIYRAISSPDSQTTPFHPSADISSRTTSLPTNSSPQHDQN